MIGKKRSTFDTVQITFCDPEFTNGQDIRFGSTADAIQLITFMLRSGIGEGVMRSLTLVAEDGTSTVIRPVSNTPS